MTEAILSASSEDDWSQWVISARGIVENTALELAQLDEDSESFPSALDRVERLFDKIASMHYNLTKIREWHCV